MGKLTGSTSHLTIHSENTTNPKTTIAHTWDSEQLRAIAHWYAASNFDPSLPGDESRTLAIDPDSAHGRILRTLQDLLESNIQSKEAAEALASLILASKDVTGSWGKMLYAVYSASEFSNRATAFRLADMMVELANMPYSLPRHPNDSNNGRSNPSSEVLSFAELPGFGLQLREAWQTPTQCIHLEDVTFEARIAARNRWYNASAFVAILTHYAWNEILPESMDWAWLGLDHITVALEGRTAPGEFTDQSTRPEITIHMERMPSLWIPAAAMWIILAGQELFQISTECTEKAGSLWAEHRRKMRPKPPSCEYSVERWSFWRQRLIDIADADVLSPQLTAVCDEAASKIAAMLEEINHS